MIIDDSSVNHHRGREGRAGEKKRTVSCASSLRMRRQHRTLPGMTTLRSACVLVLASTTVIASACAGSSDRVASPSPDRAVKITVLTSAGCGNTEPAVAQVKAVAARLGIDPSIDRVVVETVENARRLHSLGSPTLLVNGRDLDPSARDRTDYGLG